MSDRKQSSLENLADTLALRVQELRSSGLLTETATLLSLEYASQTAQAPYLFDMADGSLHRNHCAAVPNGSRSTLYAVWELGEGDEKLGCPSCCPQFGEQPQARTEGASDTLFGTISLVDQLGSILRERGRTYRNSHRQSALVAQVEKVISWLKPLRAGIRRIIGR